MKTKNIKASDVVSGALYLDLIKKYKAHDEKRRCKMELLIEENKILKSSIAKATTEFGATSEILHLGRSLAGYKIHNSKLRKTNGLLKEEIVSQREQMQAMDSSIRELVAENEQLRTMKVFSLN